MKIIARYSQILLCAMLFWACGDEIARDNYSATEDEDSNIGLCLLAAPVTSGMNNTRALPEEIDVDKITDIWLIEYDDNGTLIGLPKYYDSSAFENNVVSVSVILPKDEATEYRCVVIANTHNNISNDVFGDISSIYKLKAIKKTINVSNYGTSEQNDVFMSNALTLKRSTTSLDCDLYRNIAKLSFEIKNSDNSNVKITSVTLFNVPDKSYIADRLYDDESASVPSSADINFINYDTETVEIDEGNEYKFEYYMPRNCRGKNNATLQSNKNADAPHYATYLEINAVEKSSSVPLRYRFYPGANMVNDFNIIPNRHYTIPITIKGPGDSNVDNRVERMDNIYLSESNCYIINPLINEEQPIYWIPLSRANKFWESSDGKIVDADGQGVNNIITEATNWIVEVIWQDQPQRLIDFCDIRGNSISEDNYIGNGNMYFGVKPKKGSRGNILVGVRKTTASQQEYLWSWHLWITDYNPDIDTGWRENVYVYPVEGGSVHRYASTSWENNYKNKYIMDRNLGALAATENDYEDSRGLYWQYGNKNPIPHKDTKLYDINGNLISGDWISNVGNNVIEVVQAKAEYLYDMVRRPCTMFMPPAQSTSYGNWVVNNSYERNLWYNPSWYVSASGKSLFDPSPEGWKLVENLDVWDCFFSNPSAHNGVVNSKGEYNKGWNVIISPNGDTAWYPQAYYPTNDGDNTGAYRYIKKNQNGYVWAMRLTKTSANTYDFYLTNAMAGRCISE